MTVFRSFLALAGITLAGLIIWAIITGDFGEAGAFLFSDPWGIVSMVDLYLGFVLAAAVIFYVEKPLAALLWILPIPFLGNVWTVIWFIWRLPHLRAALRNNPKAG